MTQVIPARLHRVKVFTSVETFAPEGGGRRRVCALCGPSIEEQADAWVTATRHQVVSAGPVSVREYPAPVTDGGPHLCVERSLALVYIPAVEQQHVGPGDERHKSQAHPAYQRGGSLGGVPGAVPAGGQVPAGDAGPAVDGGRGGLRLPDV